VIDTSAIHCAGHRGIGDGGVGGAASTPAAQTQNRASASDGIETVTVQRNRSDGGEKGDGGVDTVNGYIERNEETEAAPVRAVSGWVGRGEAIVSE
jgi:hypothetical protein